MEFKDMTVDELEARKAAIAEELDTPEADLNALEKEVRSINEELENRKAAEAKKVELRTAVAAGEGEKIKEFKEETRTMPTLKEIRSSEEYINAFANYIKTNDDSECRALLSTNVSGGQVPVPEYIEGRVRTAWERSEIMNLVRKTYVRGNLKIGFELSADGAVIHTEGGPAVTPENLTFGIVTLIPQSIKKLIQISDEALELTGREFLDYLYDELTFQIVKKAEETLIVLIVDAPAVPDETHVGVPVVNSSSLTIADIITAEGQLSGEASNAVIVTTRANAAALKNEAITKNYAVDPFDGMDVHYTSQTALGTALAIVGDFGLGAHANYPNGAEIQIKFDDRVDMAKDMVNILGRQFVGLGLVANNAFVKIAPAEG